MSPLRNMPVGMSREEVVYHLRTMANGVESGDTMEGNIEFLLPFLNDPHEFHQDSQTKDHCICGQPSNSPLHVPPEQVPDLLVRGGYRVGNLMGQGGYRMIGELREISDQEGEEHD